MKKMLFFLTMLVLSSVLAVAQTRVIIGKVLDEGGAAVAGASVTIKGTGTGTSADEAGNFRINAKTGDVLVISAVGVPSLEVTVGTGNSVTVRMARQSQNLNEVVVTTALGIQRQRKEVGYATARVSSAEINQARPINIANGLQGKVSGLNVTTVNSSVFGDVRINLRGIRSLTGNNNPMLLLDGVQVPLNYLSSLNPTDVTDVTVLKGSSGAAIYGPDARNGVIVVTTKSGVRTDVPSVTVSHTTQAERISFFPKMQEEFGSGGYGEYIAYENWSWGPALDGSTKELGHVLEDGTVQTHIYNAKPDEKKRFFNTGVTIQNDISLAAKDFYLSFQDASIKGILPGDQNRRTGIRLSSSRDYGKFRVTARANYIQQNYDIFDQNQMSNYYTAQGTGLNNGIMNLIFSTPVNIPLTKYKDFKNDKFSTFNNYYNDYGLNPYFAIDNWRQTGRNDDLITNLDLSFKATDFLSFTFRPAASIRNLTARSISKGENVTAYGENRGFSSIPGAVTEYSSRNSRLSTEFFASFNKTVGDFKLSAIAGHYFRQDDTKDVDVSATQLTVPELFTISNYKGSIQGSSAMYRSRLVSGYGSIGIGYKGWVNLEITGRNDWTSLLAQENRSFFYPGANLSVVLSDAVDFIKNSRTISYAKVRGAINKTGNPNVPTYGLEAVYDPQWSGFPYGGLPGYTAGNLSADPDLKPEFILSKEVGLELGFLRNRINLELAYFHQDCDDQIISVPVSRGTGYTTIRRNAASFVNKGFEMDLKLTPLFKFRKGNIDIRANATYNNSDVKSIYEGLDRIAITALAGTFGYNQFASNYAVAGQPAFVWMLTDYVRDTLGRVIVSKTTGRPSKDPTLKMFGRTMPLWIVGITPTINWNGLTLSAVAEYRGGHYVYNQIGSDMAWTGISKASAVNHRERFVYPNSVIDDGNGKYIPNTNIAVDDVNDFITSDDFRETASNFLTSAASWRIREISLGYDVPVSVFGRQNVIKGLTVTLNARNVALWLPKTNEFSDPDFNNSSTGNSSGWGNAQINPPTRLFGANITVRF